MVHAEQERITASLGNVLKVFDDVAKTPTTNLGGRGNKEVNKLQQISLKLANTLYIIHRYSLKFSRRRYFMLWANSVKKKSFTFIIKLLARATLSL